MECELEKSKEEPDIKGTGAAGARPWKGEKDGLLGAKESRVAGASM